MCGDGTICVGIVPYNSRKLWVTCPLLFLYERQSACRGAFLACLPAAASSHTRSKPGWIYPGRGKNQALLIALQHALPILYGNIHNKQDTTASIAPFQFIRYENLTDFHTFMCPPPSSPCKKSRPRKYVPSASADAMGI